METDAGVKYGELIMIGTNGRPPNPKDAPQLKHQFELFRAEYPTAVIASRLDVKNKGDLSVSPQNPNSREAHIRMEMADKLIVVTCTAAMDKDMFQVGRAVSEKIQYCVDMPPPLPAGGTTVSRYAARIIVNRREVKNVEPGHDPHNPRLYAAAFDEADQIFLGQNATTIPLRPEEGHYDGFTTNGVLMLRPPQDFKLATATVEQLRQWKPEWVEVSVGGKIFRVQGDRRVTPTSAANMTEDTNYIPDGTIIDLCGVMLLWRSHTSLDGPKIPEAWLRQALSSVLPGQGLPKRIISCVSFDDVSIGLPPARSSVDALNDEELDAHPHIYMGCGHVVTRKYVESNAPLPLEKCPVKACGKTGRLTPLKFSLESRFFIDRPPATHCFNPCGHLVPEKTAILWSKIKAPRDPVRAICPFCGKTLDNQTPYVKLELVYAGDDDDDGSETETYD